MTITANNDCCTLLGLWLKVSWSWTAMFCVNLPDSATLFLRTNARFCNHVQCRAISITRMFFSSCSRFVVMTWSWSRFLVPMFAKKSITVLWIQYSMLHININVSTTIVLFYQFYTKSRKLKIQIETTWILNNSIFFAHLLQYTVYSLTKIF